MIWQELKRPFFVLAPMDDVTDTVFRRIINGTARPDVFFSEFASADGFMSPGRDAVEHKLRFREEEQPLIAQIWGLRPDNYRALAAELNKRGFAGIDINMGCPVAKVIKNGACSALINNRPLAAELIAATKKGAGDTPVSVKTRIGFSSIDLSWIEFLLHQDLAALTVHARTTKEQSKVPNHWEVYSEIMTMRDQIAPQTIIIANGDIADRAHGLELANQYGFDGLMIGRGVFHDPYAFSDESSWPNTSKDDKLALFRRHIELWEAEWGTERNPSMLKKFCKVYVNGFDGASELRANIMEQNTTADLLKTLSGS